jgi:hypothetical protein
MSEQYALWGDEGEQRKEEGMEKALSNTSTSEWQEAAKLWLWRLPAGRTFTAEDLVDAVGLPVGEESAGKNNAVGALMNGIAKRGVIRNTSDYTKAKRPASHGRVIAVWERTLLGKEPNVHSSTPVPVPTDAPAHTHDWGFDIPGYYGHAVCRECGAKR